MPISNLNSLLFVVTTTSTLIRLLQLLSTCTCTMLSTTTTTSLATQICKRTTNFTFCRNVIFSDPRAAEADSYLLSTMVFRQAYASAADTQKYIELKLKAVEARGLHGPVVDLRKCVGHYQEAIRALIEVIGNLDSDTFYGLDKLAADVERSARACNVSLVAGLYDVVKRNEELIKVANVCGAVSKLYSYV